MSKRHNTSRRRTYARRQHELHERLDRRHDRRSDRTWRLGSGFTLGSLHDEADSAAAAYGDAD